MHSRHRCKVKKLTCRSNGHSQSVKQSNKPAPHPTGRMSDIAITSMHLCSHLFTCTLDCARLYWQMSLYTRWLAIMHVYSSSYNTLCIHWRFMCCSTALLTLPNSLMSLPHWSCVCYALFFSFFVRLLVEIALLFCWLTLFAHSRR